MISWFLEKATDQDQHTYHITTKLDMQVSWAGNQKALLIFLENGYPVLGVVLDCIDS